MDYTQLIAALIPLVDEYGPELVKSLTDLIHQDPNATVEQIHAKIDVKLKEAKANDASVELP